MTIDIMVRGYNSMGFHPTLSLVADYLTGDGIPCGAAVDEWTVALFLPADGAPLPTLGAMFAAYREARAKLPRVRFDRKRRRMEVQVASDFVGGSALTVESFRAAGAEVFAAAPLLRRRLRPGDDFDLPALLHHLRAALDAAPLTDAELAAVARAVDRRRAEREAAESPWDALGVEWDRFHPRAREVLDDPFFWDQCHDFAPHGNDTGSDFLADYRRWRKREPGGDAVAFYRRTVRGWGFDSFAPGSPGRETADEAAVALAFAELKLSATCPPAVAALARRAIRRQRRDAHAATDWPHREERLRRLDQLEAKLPARTSGG